MDYLTTMLTTPGFTDEKIHLYMATELSVGETKHEADEFLDLQPMPLSRALEMVKSGEIRDGKTGLGLLFAAGFRAGR
jgi:ADP-ribose pyrophosphatase